MSFSELLDVLYEDNHLLVINKPAGWPTAHAETQDTMLDVVKEYIKEKYHKPGNVFMGLVHRIDKPVTGVLLFARTSKAASRLSKQFLDRTVEKVYWAVVERFDRASNFADAGFLEDYLAKDPHTGVVHVVGKSHPEAQHAATNYYLKRTYEQLALLELLPQTGRRHQMRVQLASRGLPVYADAKYGGTHNLGGAIALHARSLTFLHPITAETITVTAEIPQNWKGRFAHLMVG
ncbi:MAG: RluA family pseudouridine synthase [Zavarzinella sp.]